MTKEFKTISIDSSTTACGIAVYNFAKLEQSFTKEFTGTFSVEKLQRIAKYFEDLFCDHAPEFIIIEEPFAMAKNGRTASALNQVVGAIVSMAVVYRADVAFLHNRTVKRLMGFKTKEDSIKLTKKLYKIKVTEHEADAIMMFEAYRKYLSEKNKVKTNRKSRKAKPKSK